MWTRLHRCTLSYVSCLTLLFVWKDWWAFVGLASFALLPKLANGYLVGVVLLVLKSWAKRYLGQVMLLVGVVTLS